MGSGGKSSPPSVPDFMGAAQNQTAANRPDQYGPFGSTTWSYTPNAASPDSQMQMFGQTIDKPSWLGGGQDPGGTWTQNTTLDPGIQAAIDSITGGLANQANPGNARDQAIQAAYGQATSRLDPQWSNRADALQTQLSNQGLTPGSRAYTSAQQDFGNARNDAYAQAMYNAQTGAGNAAFGQTLAANMQPYQQLGAIQGLTHQNGFMPAADTLGALGAGYNAQLGQYGIDQAGKNSTMGGLSNLAGLGILKYSDERLKQNIERLPFEAIPGVPFATWEWKHRPGERQLGVIAQDLEKVRPDLVEVRDGLRLVNYSGLWEARNA